MTLELSVNGVVDRTREYIVLNFLYTRPGFHIDIDDFLLQAEILDSMGVLELLQFLEAEFRITVEEDEVTQANFGSLGRIAQFVLAKRERGGQD